MTVMLIENKEQWDKFVDENPNGLIYHKWDFLKIVEKHTGFQFLPIGIFNGQILVGILPLFFQNKIIKMLFSSPPNSAIPYSGFLLTNEYDQLKQDKKESIMKLVVDDIQSATEKFSPNYISILTVPGYLDIRQFKWHGYDVIPNYSYSIDLTRPIESIWGDFKKNLRKQLKIAEDRKLKFQQSNDVDLFYRFLSDRYSEQNLRCPIISKEYLQELIDTFPQEILLHYILDENDEPIGAIITQHYKKVIVWLGNTRINDNNFGNEFSIWKLIQLGKSEKLPILEINGASHKGLCQFKSKFNPSLTIQFIISRKDITGKFAEKLFQIFVKRRFLKFPFQNTNETCGHRSYTGKTDMMPKATSIQDEN
ncbi:MAG: GNAT family N-acetyltransferase [Methanoregula sp.]|jgi:hypothetical protein|uniref:GNAT family N-acetyltransferase n=1 Tax=Methanoregula sp. TaxID=2052170 RepID=UPI003D09ED42